jgi:hypothetical protein
LIKLLNDEDQAVVSQAAAMVVFQLSKKKEDNYREVGQSENGCFGAPTQIQSKLSVFQWFSTVTHHGR